MRGLPVVLLLLLLIMQYRLWWGDNGYFERQRVASELAAVKLEQQAQLARNDHLRARVADLKSSHDTVEELARQNLGLIKPGETFVMMHPETP